MLEVLISVLVAAVAQNYELVGPCVLRAKRLSCEFFDLE